jgi:hypothetical protein
MSTTNDQPAADYATLRTLADNQAEDIERLHAKIANQAERIRHLEGATNHATGTPLSQAQAKIAALETQLEAHAWKISPAMAQAQIDRLLADKARLDWLEANGDELWCTENVAGNIEDYWIHSTRAAIDAARKQGQP